MDDHKIYKMFKQIESGSKLNVRLKLKKYSIPERMKVLNIIIPKLKDASPLVISFFKENFSVEIGSLVVSDYDIQKAVKIYKNSIK